MPLAPDVLVPLLVASFESMAAIPLGQSGQLPPPAKVTLRWKEEAMARLAMAKVGTRCNGTARLRIPLVNCVNSLLQDGEQAYTALP